MVVMVGITEVRIGVIWIIKKWELILKSFEKHLFVRNISVKYIMKQIVMIDFWFVIFVGHN